MKTQRMKLLENKLRKMVREELMKEEPDFDRSVYSGALKVLGNYLISLQKNIPGGVLKSAHWNGYIDALKKAIQEARTQMK